MIKVKSRIFKTILQLNAINPCNRFKFELDGSTLEISSICIGQIDLKSRTYTISFAPSQSEIVEQILKSMCYTIPKYRGYYMDVTSIPTDNICDRVFRAMYQISTCLSVFEFDIKHEENSLIITNAPLQINDYVVKEETVTYAPHEAEEVKLFLNTMFKQNSNSSTHWYMRIEYLFTCV